ncbi:hypothetical protein BDY19DRAFT_178630 [Irpex rosettiformis]|uniref:Uncharacterized protein n=1 Tax=Irpex rosettiformis TaxID=378272 RepID=A0ACB8U371_9APHY|nr:hypothetical protein BDY19DRAFT_178630 [Irpex rosettiformis]
MNGTVIDGCTITVRYHEPGAQGIFRNRYSSNSAPPPAQPGGAPASEQPASPNGTRATSEPDEAQQAREQQQRQEAAAQELREAAERRAKEAAAMKAAAEKVKRQQDRRARREAAERAEQQAKKNLDAARADEDNAEIEVLLVSEAKATADAMLADAKLASLEAKRAWLLAMDKEAKAERVANDALEDIEHALHKRQQAEACRKIAEQEEISFRKAREDIDNEAEEDEIKVDEETLRLAELAEKIKRMEELKKLEKEEKEARQRREQEAKKAEEERLEQERKKREKEEAERLARLREEAERLARERQEREAQEKRQAENTKRLYFQAAMAERARCNKRDLRYCATWDMTMWNVQRALDRFVGVSEEFDSLKFHETAQPLTFESIPWPILDHPHRMSLDLIEGIAVNKFFATMKSMQTHGEYMSMIKKARNRFHPDRWRSRGILNSVLDENLRGRLETAGNEVSKQINHLWDKGL